MGSTRTGDSYARSAMIESFFYRKGAYENGFNLYRASRGRKGIPEYPSSIKRDRSFCEPYSCRHHGCSFRCDSDDKLLLKKNRGDSLTPIIWILRRDEVSQSLQAGLGIALR